MKKILPLVWNVIVVTFLVFVFLVFVPRIKGQFTYPQRTADMIAVGYLGIGLYIAILICAVSLLSPFWFRIPLWLRLVYVAVILVLGVGYFYAVNLYQSAPVTCGPFVSTPELITFFGSITVILAPQIGLGVGFPGLFSTVRKRFTSK